MRFAGGTIRQNTNAHLGVLLIRQVQEIQAAAAFKDNLLRTNVWEMNIQFVESSNLPELSFRQIISPNVCPLVLVAIGKKVQGRAMPHRLRVGGLIAGDVFGRKSFKVKQPN